LLDVTPENASSRAADALFAANCFALDPSAVGGIVVRTDRGPTCELWLQQVAALLGQSTTLRCLPPHIDDERLLGGIDLTASLRAGRSVYTRGLLAEADGGVLVMSMAERVSRHLAALVAAALDSHCVAGAGVGAQLAHSARFGLIALDSGQGDEERCSATLTERLAMQIDLRKVDPQDLATSELERVPLEQARCRVASVSFRSEDVSALCSTASACGIDSLRAPLWALRVARANAALQDREALTAEDLQLAARLVLGPRARVNPQAQDSEGASAESPPPQNPETGQAEPAPGPERITPEASQDLLLAAARASIPAHLLDGGAIMAPRMRRSASSGRSGATLQTGRRGRPAGVRVGRPRAGSRLNLMATLRCAAPWQRQRRAHSSVPRSGVLVHVEDFRVTQFTQRSETATLFVLDASGSSAMSRLAEVKGAIELLLAQCYVRRDQVAVLAFRGRGAQLLLPPTRSLVRAKRSLAQLPGGGATPLASGLDLARQLAEQLRRRGLAPTVVVLTDGHANIARDGSGGRQQAEADALLAARLLHYAGFKALLIDTARRPQPLARSLAEAMQARYLPLPYADARTLLSAVQSKS
jgi:magnesium chelatase subunit D